MVRPQICFCGKPQSIGKTPIKNHTYHDEPFPTASEALPDVGWSFVHGFTAFLLVLVVESESCDTFTQCTGDTRHGPSSPT